MIADHAPSIDQIDQCARILSREAHPLVSGEVICGHAATYCDRTRVYSLAVYVVRDPDEIWATYLTRCFRIHGDGSIDRASLDRWPQSMLETLNA